RTRPRPLSRGSWSRAQPPASELQPRGARVAAVRRPHRRCGRRLAGGHARERARSRAAGHPVRDRPTPGGTSPARTRRERTPHWRFGGAGCGAGPVYPLLVAASGDHYPGRAAAVTGCLPGTPAIGAIIYPPVMGFVSVGAGLGAAMLGAAALVLACGIVLA